MQELKEKESELVSQNMRRPPYLWNHPQIEEDKHHYRAIAAPKESYVDKRIDKILELIKELSKDLCSHSKEHWDEVINRCIDCFNNHHNPNP